MSGHSKWHNIQARKSKVDAARGKIFIHKMATRMILIILFMLTPPLC